MFRLGSSPPLPFKKLQGCRYRRSHHHHDGFTGAKVLSVGFGALGIGLGIRDIVSSVKTIQNRTETGKQMRNFANAMDKSTKELLDIYNKLT